MKCDALGCAAIGCAWRCVETVYGYPPDGARDLPAFKRFLRSHQVPSELFFSAYPTRRTEHRQQSGPCAQVIMSTPPLPDDVLADIQGFITTATGTSVTAAYLFVSFRCGTSPALAGIGGAGHYVLEPLADAAGWKKLKPVRGGQHRLYCRRAHSPRHPVTRPLHIPCGVSGRHRARGAIEDSWRHGGERPDRSGSLGGPASPPLHAVVFIHAVTAAGLNVAVDAQARSSPKRTAVSSSCPAACRAAIVPMATTNRSGSTTASRSRRLQASPATAFRRANSFSGTRTTTGSFHRHRCAAELDRRAPAPAGQSVSCVTSAARSRPQRIICRVPQASARCRRLLAVHETGNGARRAEEDAGRMIWLASRFVGRWPSGAPLVLTPHTDDPRLGDRDDFLYRMTPTAWPVRLARTSAARTRATSSNLPGRAVAQHVRGASAAPSRAGLRPGVVRSGRSRRSAQPRAAQRSSRLADDGRARGIHFFCVNASIRSQFEFVQQTWCNNPHFGGLNDNKDPIVGDNARTGQPSSHMTIPGSRRDHARPRCRAS